MSTPTPESAEKKIASRSALFETVALLLLSVATVGTAWCSYQAASWGGYSAGRMNHSNSAARRAAALQLQASQMAVMDVMLFSSFLDAQQGGRDKLADFYRDRFRPEAKTAFDKWIALRPFETAGAPPHPFVPELYQPQLLTDAAKADAESQDYWRQGSETAAVSRNYVLITVLLASALFFSGVAARFSSPGIRRGLLAVGLAAFLFALGRMLFLPAMW
jgi:hypothetical protein